MSENETASREGTNAENAKVAGELANIKNFLENQSALLNQIAANSSTASASPDPTILNYLDNQSKMLTQLIETVSTLHAQTMAALQNMDSGHDIILQSIMSQAMTKRNTLNHKFLKQDAQQTHYTPATPKNFVDHLTALEELAPVTFPKWLKLFRHGEAVYKENSEGSLANWGDKYAEGFRNFCFLNMTGRVLDIGSGPKGKPFYLQGYPSDLISAIEPLEVEGKVDFELVQAFNEQLPWPDRSFNAVINSTSLDHVLSLDKSMEETHRVLTDDGKFIVWVGSVPGARPYDPLDPQLEPIDEFHLFHIEEKWFEPYISRWFEIKEKITFPNASFTHIFYVFSKKM